MNILVISQYYWPEPFNCNEVCEELVARGHQVTVIAGTPNYPEGSVYPGYDSHREFVEIIKGVRVIRARVAPRGTTTLGRVRNYFLYPLSAKEVLKRLDTSFDVIFVFQLSPVMMAEAGIWYAKRTGLPLLHYVIDLWPESLVMGGIERRSALYRIFARISSRLYAQADRLEVSSTGFIGYLTDLLGKQVQATYLPQFAEDIFLSDRRSLPQESQSHFDSSNFNLVFAGNIGAAQAVDVAVRAAEKLKDDHVVFHIVGSGSELSHCERLSQELGLENVVFHGRHPLEEMPAYYAAADAMLITFAPDPILAYTLPRKVQSYMAAGKPIIGSVDGAAKEAIDDAGCGWTCETGDVEGLVEAVKHAKNATLQVLSDKGKAARDYYLANFSRNRFFETLESDLYALKGTTHEN